MFTHLQAHLMTKQITKSMPRSRRRQPPGVKNTYARHWRLKRREGVCFEGVYFQELTVTRMSPSNEFICMHLNICGRPE